MINALRDNAKAVEVVNNWWLRHIERINEALSSGGVSDDELMIINRLSTRELTKALRPFVNARYRGGALSQGLGSRLLGMPCQWRLVISLGA